MLDVIFYQSNKDLLVKMRTNPAQLVICPSPQVADNLRNLAPDLEVITISKWTSDHLKGLGISRSRKSELMLKFSSIWRHYFVSEKTEVFLEAFELFTELRSYTLNLELLSEFFKELDEVIVKSIFVFWAFLDQEKLVDEHLSYKKVPESKHHRPMCFIGFIHMSGIQVDMLKTLSENQKIDIFFPAPVFQETLCDDWIRWLVEEKSLKQNSDPASKRLRISILPKSKANLALNKFFESHADYDLVIASNQTSLISLQETQKKGSFFKTAEDLFAVETKLIILNLRNRLTETDSMRGDELSSYLEQLKLSSAESGQYRKYKVIELLIAAVNDYSEFQTEVDEFALDIFQLIITLNAPRVFLLTLEYRIERSVLDINDLNFRDDNKPTAILATESMGGFRAKEKLLSEAMTKALRSIGPIKRAGLDFLFYKYELLLILNRSESVLLIEEGLLDTDLSWREIIKEFELAELNLNVKYSTKKIREYLLPKMKSGPFTQKYLSASRLQAYIDCPRKFYFNYIDKVDSNPDERASLDSSEIGKLEHKVIAAYFESVVKNHEIDPDHHRKTCTKIFESYLISSKLILNETEKAKSYNEIMHYTWNGIGFLINLIKSKNAKSIRFEIPLSTNPWNLVGSIDCLLELENNKIIVVDFKRSNAGTGTKTETTEFKKVQLWVYLLVLIHHGHTIDSFGYLNLSDLTDDKLFFETDEAQKIIEESMDLAQAFIETIIDELEKMITFSPQPRDPKVCNFCSVNLFCLKGNSSE